MMSEFRENLSAIAVAAWRDTLKSFFNPLHTAKIVFGVVKDEPIREKIEKVRNEMRAKRSTTVPR